MIRMTADSTWSTLALEHGVTIDEAPPKEDADLSLRVPGWKDPVPFRVVLRHTPPRPHSLRAIFEQRGDTTSDVHLLMVVPKASSEALAQARQLGISVIVGGEDDLHGMLSDGRGRWFFLEGSGETKDRAGGRKRRGPRPWGLYAVAFEVLAQFPHRPRQVDLARNLDLSQGLVSRALHRVHKIASPTDDDPRPAIAQWLREDYPTDTRATTTWMTLGSPAESARSVSHLLSKHQIPHAVSGQVAADQIAPWSRPQTALVWTPALLDLTAAGATPVAPAEANLILSVPADPHLLATTTMGDDDRLPVISPWRVWLDVVRSGDEEGADMLMRALIAGRA